LVPLYLLRVWLPDRPGALGAVASRIGAVRGDVTAIDVLERGAGRVIDELVVDLPSDSLVGLLVGEVGEVDGVDVEDVRRVAGGQADARLDALETACVLVREADVAGLLGSLAQRGRRDFAAQWAAVVDLASPAPVAVAGTPPPSGWLGAFVAGARSSHPVTVGAAGPEDVAWASLDGAELSLVLGRGGRPFRARERRQVAALARIADHRWVELAGRSPRTPDPAAR
jgi:hypothetical protein